MIAHVARSKYNILMPAYLRVEGLVPEDRNQAFGQIARPVYFGVWGVGKALEIVRTRLVSIEIQVIWKLENSNSK